MSLGGLEPPTFQFLAECATIAPQRLYYLFIYAAGVYIYIYLYYIYIDIFEDIYGDFFKKIIKGKLVILEPLVTFDDSYEIYLKGVIGCYGLLHFKNNF